jgi:hypothetical protein
MDRRQFLACSAAAALMPAAPVPAAPSVPVGMDLAAGADRTALVFFEVNAGSGNSWAYHRWYVDSGTINVSAWGEALMGTEYFPDRRLTLISEARNIGP